MVIGDYQGYAVEKGTPVSPASPGGKGYRQKRGRILSGFDPAVPAAVQNAINPAPYSSFVIIHRADGGFVFNMDECLTGEDNEEHHRVFFYSFLCTAKRTFCSRRVERKRALLSPGTCLQDSTAGSRQELWNTCAVRKYGRVTER
jgi:hypothetical protein